MTEADACRRNFTLNHQSDIFNQKDLTSKEFQYSQKAHNPNVSNKTSCNFMTWEDSKNFNNTISSLPNYSRKKRIFCSRQIAKPKNFEEKLYRVDDLPKKTFNYLGQKETLFMGDYEGNELQLPAMFIVNEDGVVEYANYARNIVDLPTVDEVLAML